MLHILFILCKRMLRNFYRYDSAHDRTLYVHAKKYLYNYPKKPMIDDIVKASESKEDFMARIARRMQRKEVPFSSSSSHLGTLQN